MFFEYFQIHLRLSENFLSEVKYNDIYYIAVSHVNTQLCSLSELDCGFLCIDERLESSKMYEIFITTSNFHFFLVIFIEVPSLSLIIKHHYNR